MKKLFCATLIFVSFHTLAASEVKPTAPTRERSVAGKTIKKEKAYFDKLRSKLSESGYTKTRL